MKEIAELLGGMDRMLVMKLFLAEPKTVFTSRKVADRTGVDGRAVRSILSLLERAKYLVEVVSRPQKPKRGKKIEKEERKWRLNTNAPYLSAFELLLKPSSLVTDDHLIDHFGRIGKLQMVVLSGIFQELDPGYHPIDLLVVADRVNESKVDSAFESFEDTLGEEVRYAVLSSEEYLYRKEMRDKMLRELFANPHRIVVNKLGRVTVEA